MALKSHLTQYCNIYYNENQRDKCIYNIFLKNLKINELLR